LIDSEALQEEAAISPDNKFIFFVSSYCGNADIYRAPLRTGKTGSMKDAKSLTPRRELNTAQAHSSEGRRR
jgi:Tol biopolymer transport system component